VKEDPNVWWSLESSNAWWLMEGSNVWWSLKGSNVWWSLKGSNGTFQCLVVFEREGEASFSPFLTSPSTTLLEPFFSL
jgi:hypothetical protein